MGKKVKSIILVLVVTVAVMGLAALKDAGATSYFSATQTMRVTSNTWSFTLMQNMYTGAYATTNWVFGGYSFNYPLPYNAWFVLAVYDWMKGGWDEVIWISDENW